jgi:sterol desaturase/sphingolipid hydroxylase (fatty acid hydroxylase superfamily)
MNLELAVLLSIPVLFFGLLLLERLFPARPLPRIAGWRGKGLLFFVLTSALFITAPLLWMEFISRWRLMNLEWAGIAGGAVIAYVGTQFFQYWWHRLMHNSDFLWRWFHQMHHSAERLDIYGSSYFHPLDVVGFAFVQSVVPFLVFGVRPEAALIAGFVGTFYAMFQHTNVRTPQWLGYVIQRPESHSVHHARGVHGFNYADFPLWDLVFGTFRNPQAFEAETGFWDGASKRIGKLLLGRDVSARELVP